MTDKLHTAPVSAGFIEAGMLVQFFSETPERVIKVETVFIGGRTPAQKITFDGGHSRTVKATAKAYVVIEDPTGPSGLSDLFKF